MELKIAVIFNRDLKSLDRELIDAARAARNLWSIAYILRGATDDTFALEAVRACCQITFAVKTEGPSTREAREIKAAICAEASQTKGGPVEASDLLFDTSITA